MTLDVRFHLHHIEYSIIVNHFRQYFDKRYCLVLRLTFVLLVLMVEFGQFVPTYLTLDRDNPGIGYVQLTMFRPFSTVKVV